MRIAYVLWDDANRYQETFHGPCRLAQWPSLPKGWSIERFLGDVSQGTVSLDDVRAHRNEIAASVLASFPPF